MFGPQMWPPFEHLSDLASLALKTDELGTHRHGDLRCAGSESPGVVVQSGSEFEALLKGEPITEWDEAPDQEDSPK